MEAHPVAQGCASMRMKPPLLRTALGGFFLLALSPLW